MDLLELAALPLVERLDHLDDVCRRLDCGVPAETSVSVAQLRELRKALKARAEIERLREALTEARKFINERGLKDSDYGMATDTCNILAKIDAALTTPTDGDDSGLG